ncbi:Uncharacterised protein [Vibrio cholerae]|nr:Uncharacterised protein [Vibrio cholerae]CSB84225.1 Uncharacterised protein [Vibrio cholerae]CSC28518.1 Uncharacterised protein [Vibrio cholerae]
MFMMVSSVEVSTRTVDSVCAFLAPPAAATSRDSSESFTAAGAGAFAGSSLATAGFAAAGFATGFAAGLVEGALASAEAFASLETGLDATGRVAISSSSTDGPLPEPCSSSSSFSNSSSVIKSSPPGADFAAAGFGVSVALGVDGVTGAAGAAVSIDGPLPLPCS